MQAVIILSIAAAVIWLLWKHYKEVAADDFEREMFSRTSKGTRDLDQEDLDRASDEGMNHPDDGMR